MDEVMRRTKRWTLMAEASIKTVIQPTGIPRPLSLHVVHVHVVGGGREMRRLINNQDSRHKQTHHQMEIRPRYTIRVS